MFINGDCIQEYRLENDISLEEMADILSIDAEIGRASCRERV